jgi:hypothetical protein
MVIQRQFFQPENNSQKIINELFLKNIILRTKSKKGVNTTKRKRKVEMLVCTDLLLILPVLSTVLMEDLDREYSQVITEAKTILLIKESAVSKVDKSLKTP